MIYCPPEQVDSEMDAFISVYANEMKDAHILIRAAWTHFTFVQIHPFQDGNGRIARLLTSLVLIQGGLFPFALERSQRPQYIEALEAADDGNYQPLLDMLMNDQLDSMGPEVAAKALAVNMQKKYSAVNELQEKTHARKNDIDVYCCSLVEQKIVVIDQKLKPMGGAHTHGWSIVNSRMDAWVHIYDIALFRLSFSTRIERSSICLEYSLQKDSIETESANETDSIVISLDMDEETWRFHIEDFIQKKLTCALRYITQSMR